MADPPSISAFDLDVVKLTAQFVARNGRQFLTQLMQKEQRNYQFDFLRPQHSLFNYFTKLVEQYTKVSLYHSVPRTFSAHAYTLAQIIFLMWVQKFVLPLVTQRETFTSTAPESCVYKVFINVQAQS